MKIVIPMSGRGQRFVNAGYKDPKPLIKIDGKPIIEHVVDLFPGEEDFVFICSQDHLETTDMRETLERIAPKGKIVSIDPHKLGPVYAVSKVFDLIDNDEEVIVNYCDFGTYWDYSDFLNHTRSRDADGAVISYKGFHPHMMGSTNYAFQRSEKQWMLEIKEKEPFTDNRMNEYASNGTYYFKKGSYVKKYFQLLMEREIDLKGEYYVSLIYNLLVEDKLKVSIYEIQHMLQWGTPADVEEYKRWANYFEGITKQEKISLSHKNELVNLIPLAGRGSRFVAEGYKDPKPLISVSGKPMIVQASSNLPPADKFTFICLGEHKDKYGIDKKLQGLYEGAEVITLDQVTEGQACTCEIATKNMNPEASLIIAACDNGMLWDAKKYQSLLDNQDIDVIVWTFKNHPSANMHPQMYGWVACEQGPFVSKVSVKKAISDNVKNDHGIVGTFYVRQVKHFNEAVQRLYKNNRRINNEFYVDSCLEEFIEVGLKVAVFEVDHYVSWGTPSELKTFEYWQSFFHKWDFHPYTIQQDPFVEQGEVDRLVSSSCDFKQPFI